MLLICNGAVVDCVCRRFYASSFCIGPQYTTHNSNVCLYIILLTKCESRSNQLGNRYTTTVSSLGPDECFCVNSVAHDIHDNNTKQLFSLFYSMAIYVGFTAETIAIKRTHFLFLWLALSLLLRIVFESTHMNNPAMLPAFNSVAVCRTMCCMPMNTMHGLILERLALSLLLPCIRASTVSCVCVCIVSVSVCRVCVCTSILWSGVYVLCTFVNLYEWYQQSSASRCSLVCFFLFTFLNDAECYLHFKLFSILSFQKEIILMEPTMMRYTPSK